MKLMETPKAYDKLYEELKTIPFYRTEKGYQYAAYLLGSHSASAVQAILKETEEPEGEEPPLDIDEVKRDAARPVVKDAMERLTSLVVSDIDLTAWLTFEKAQGAVLEYQEIMEALRTRLMWITFNIEFVQEGHRALTVEEETRGLVEQKTKTDKKCIYGGSTIQVLDADALYEAIKDGMSKSDDMVLNRNNPFADISIKDQQFLYGSIMGQFESLGLTTSHVLTKVPKTTEQSYLVLQPGFKIRKSKDLVSDKKSILFDDTLTSRIVEDDSNLYIYL